MRTVTSEALLPSSGGEHEQALRAVAYCCLSLAVELHREGRRASAGHLAHGAVAVDPRYATARAFVGLFEAGRGDAPEATRQLAIAVVLDPKNVRTRVDLADAARLGGALQLAASQYRQALAQHPGLSDAANNLAWILATHPDADARDAREAVRLAERACAARGDEPAFLDTLAAAYAEAGRFNDALRAIDQALRGGAKPKQQLAYRRLLYEARRPFRSGARHPALRATQPRGAHLELGRKLVAAARLAEAAAHYEAALRYDTRDVKTLNDLAALLVQQGKTVLAAARLARAARLKPESVKPFVNLAWLHATAGDERLRDPAEAVLLAEVARDRDPDSIAVLDALGVAYAAAGRFDDAITAAEDAIAHARAADQPRLAAAIAQRLGGLSRRAALCAGS